VDSPAPFRPDTRDQNPEEAICVGQSWSWAFVFENGDLLSQCNILKDEFLPAPQSGSKGLSKNDEPPEHVWSLTRLF